MEPTTLYQLFDFPETHYGPGVYWLLTADNDTYVGKAQNVRRRLLNHRSDGRHWIKYGLLEYWNEMEPGLDRELYAREHFWIRLLKPSLNKKIPPDYVKLTPEQYCARRKAKLMAWKAARKNK